MPISSNVNLPGLRKDIPLPYGSEHLQSEFREAPFALFFKNPPYDEDPQAIRNFCFDDDYGNLYRHRSLSATRETIQLRFRRLFPLDEVDLIYPFVKNSADPTQLFFQLKPTKTRTRFDSSPSSRDRPFYLAPWLGIPIDLSSGGTDPSVTIPVSNAWRLHDDYPNNLSKLRDSYWRSRLPNESAVKLELMTYDADIEATWVSSGTSIQTYDFSHDAASVDKVGSYTDNAHQNNLFEDAVTIKLKADVISTGRQVRNEDVPRKLYIRWERGNNDWVTVGSLSILPFPIYDHYLWFINVTQEAPLLWTFRPLGMTNPPFIPQSLDLVVDAINTNHRTLGSYTRDFFLNQYGVNLITVDNIAAVANTFRNDDGTPVGPGTRPLFSQVDADGSFFSTATPAPWTVGQANERDLFTQGIQQSFHNFLTGFRNRAGGPAPTFNRSLGNLLDGLGNPVIDPVTGQNVETWQNFTLAIPGVGNLAPNLSNLSVVYLCHTLPPKTFADGAGALVLGEGTSHAGFTPWPIDPLNLNGPNYIYANQALGKFQNARSSFPHAIFLYDSELTDANAARGGVLPNLIPPNRLDGGICCHRESTLVHELLHNFGFHHIFSEYDNLGNKIPITGMIYSHFRNNFRKYFGGRIGALKPTTITDWTYHIPANSTAFQDATFVSLRDKVNDITGYANLDLSFNYLDFVSYYGVESLIEILLTGLDKTLAGNIDGDALGLYPNPTRPVGGVPRAQGVSIPFSGYVNGLNYLNGDNAWLILLDQIARLFAFDEQNDSPDIYQTTYPPLNLPDQPSTVIPTGPVATADIPFNTDNSTYDPRAGNSMDYNFELDLSDSRDNSFFSDLANNTSIRTDRGYLMKHQWDTLRHAIRYFNRFQP